MKNSEFIIIDEETKKSLRIFSWVFGVILIGLFTYLKLTENKTTINEILKKQQNTRVIKIYQNKQEHNWTFVKFSNGKEKILDFPYKIGDSISKKQNDSIEYIFRDGETFKKNLLEEYRKFIQMKN